MSRSKPQRTRVLAAGSRGATAGLALLFALSLVANPAAHAQTYTVLYNFTGGADGAIPSAGLVMDGAGNLYGTAASGGKGGCRFGYCGTVFKLAHKGSGWVLSVLYSFVGGNDGFQPMAPLAFGPDGSLYGTTLYGGHGFGTVFKLQPPATACKSALCPWTETQLYSFTGGSDGGEPETGGLTFDAAGNIYGTTSALPGTRYGSVYELTPANGKWTASVLYSFPGGDGANSSESGVVFDASGNLWGTTRFGGVTGCGSPGSDFTCGVLFELVPSGSGWIGNTVYQFSVNSGGNPLGNLISDPSGNLYGTTSANGAHGGGTVYQLTPSSGMVTVEYPLAGSPSEGPNDSVVMDAAGNLYGTTLGGGAHQRGTVFRLTPSNSGWIYTNLHDFAGGSDGAAPSGKLILDSDGNLYGTTMNGGLNCAGSGGCGIAFEISP